MGVLGINGTISLSSKNICSTYCSCTNMDYLFLGLMVIWVCCWYVEQISSSTSTQYKPEPKWETGKHVPRVKGKYVGILNNYLAHALCRTLSLTGHFSLPLLRGQLTSPLLI